MTTNFSARGDVVNYIAGGTISSGDLLVMGHTLGVALSDAVSGETIAVAIEGVFEVPKVSAAVFAVGEKLILDVSATPDAFDDSSASPATGDITGGAIAMRLGAASETTCLVKPTPGNATKT